MTFGIERPAAVRASAIVDRGIEGTSARIETPRGAFDVATPLVGRGNLANVLAATAVALEFDVPLEAIAERARRLEPAAHRGQIVRLRGGVTIIDDSYNANPTATRQALDVLARANGRRRGAWPCWARCWSSATAPWRFTRTLAGRLRAPASMCC